MATAPHIKELRKKTVIDKLKNSAIFILLMIILAIAGVILFVVWLSGLLRGDLQNEEIFTDQTFYWFVGIAAFFIVFFTLSWLIQRAAHGAAQGAKHKH